jgi:hypothetical protein
MNIKPLIEQLELIVAEFEAMSPKAQHNDLSDLPKHDRQALVTRAVAAVTRIVGTNSTHAPEIQRLFKDLPHLHTHTTSIIGVVKALLSDVKAGHHRCCCGAETLRLTRRSTRMPAAGRRLGSYIRPPPLPPLEEYNNDA